MLIDIKDVVMSVVVVLFKPDEDTVKFVLDMAQIDQLVVVIVNEIDKKYLPWLENVPGLHFRKNASNFGLAKALNQGCNLAFELGATHVMLLDQDSRPDHRLSKNLLADLIDLERCGELIAAVGPKLVDVKAKTPIEVVGNPTEIETERFTAVDTLATSGSLVSRAALEAVGEMYEWFFIDDIDHEWCFRAQFKGYTVVRSNHREMLHNMGDDGITLLGRYRPLHRSPIRHYYITRNTVYLCKQRYARLRWRIIEALKLFYRIPIYIIISTNNLASFRNVISGLVDGIRKKSDYKTEN